MVQLMEQQDNFMDIIQNPNKEPKINLNRFDVQVEVGHLRKYSAFSEQAYDMRMRLTTYWMIVMMRMVDEFALHILHSLKMFVEEEMEAALVNEIVGLRKSTNIKQMFEKSPMTAVKKGRSKKSFEFLNESDTTVTIVNEFGSLIMDTPAKEDTSELGQDQLDEKQPIERPRRGKKLPAWLKDYIH